MSRIQDIGEEIAREINNLKHPFIVSAQLDDFSDYSGRIFIDLKMETPKAEVNYDGCSNM